MTQAPSDASLSLSKEEEYLERVMRWHSLVRNLAHADKVVLRVAAGTLGAFPREYFLQAAAIYNHPDLPAKKDDGGSWLSSSLKRLEAAKLARSLGNHRQIACGHAELQDLLLVEFLRTIQPQQLAELYQLAISKLSAMWPTGRLTFMPWMIMTEHDGRLRDFLLMCRMVMPSLPQLPERESAVVSSLKHIRLCSLWPDALRDAGLVGHLGGPSAVIKTDSFRAHVEAAQVAFFSSNSPGESLEVIAGTSLAETVNPQTGHWSSAVFLLAMAGRLDDAARLLDTPVGEAPLDLGRALAAALRGDPAPLFEATRSAKWGSGENDIPAPLSGYAGGLIYWLGALAMRAGKWPSVPQVLARLTSDFRREDRLIELLHAICALLRTDAKGDANSVTKATELATDWRNAPVTMRPLLGIALMWAGRLVEMPSVRVQLARDAALLESLGWKWLALQAAGLSLAAGNKGEILRVRRLARELNARPLHEMVSLQAPWERRLRALLAMADRRTGKAVKAPRKSTRLVWIIEVDDDGVLTNVVLATQVRNSKSGVWEQAKAISRPRLVKNRGADLPEATEADRLAIGFLVKSKASFYSYVDYEWDPKVLTALCGHPAVYLGEAVEARRVELVAEKPRLRVERVGTSYLISMVPNPLDREQEVVALPRGPRRLGVYTFTKEDRELATLIAAEALSVPAEGAPLIGELVESLAPIIPLESEGLDEELGATQPADVAPFLGLEPYDTGVKLRVLLRPFGAEGPVFSPASGAQMMTVEREGRHVRLLRDFKAEKAAAAALLDRLPQFAGLDGAECDWTWPVVDPQACLEVIDSLEELRGMVPIEWAQNARPITTRRADVGAMRVQVSTAGDWFALSGQVEVEPGTLLEMTALLERWDERRGRFVPLGDGRWLALSRRLQQRVEEMRALAHAESREGLRLHSLAPLAAPQLMDGLGGAALADEWRRRAKRWEEAGSMEIAVPSTLQAELRPYQEEGFRWLARLAYAGAGACLADDMGLGKTLQALALLLLRGADGPALVLAPASVTPNWLAEARRFAPTLNCTLFGSGDRASTIRDAGPFDVIVASYGILATEAELLASRPWHTLLLDEAQAIKNQQTIRSQAVMDMRADFRLALTGTPLENHLGELWNLFRFLNPGLLGSRERFENRFAQPIERLKDRAAMANLKRVISPFILRRTKQEVLPDLPPATEITLKVPMEPAERAFYEAVREQALRTLEDIGQEATARVRVLAEIMRLRRACCHPSLLVPDCGLSGSKMAEFLRLAAELRDNRHRALVFSQFVDHLALLRVALDKAGITYQYLDGSTPIAEREAAVRRFQGGEGDLFLISLKAGGTGLNLTAADYVIHMDPWWNPAVEDQASARAHRIGQDRPVTIYRLVMENSIEERIVALHHSKRRMADDLLDETSQAGRLSAQELLALIRLH